MRAFHALTAALTCIASSVPPLPIASQDAYGILQQDRPDLHAGRLDLALARFLDRVARPIPADPTIDFRELQEKHLNESDDLERRYLNELRRTTDRTRLFAIEADASTGGPVIRRGILFQLEDGQWRKYEVFAHATPARASMLPGQVHSLPTGWDSQRLSSYRPTAQSRVTRDGPIAIRRMPLTGVISGYFFGNAVPSVARRPMRDPGYRDRWMRVDAALDQVVGRGNDGPLLTYVEFGIDWLAADIYLHMDTFGDMLLKSGPLGSAVTMTPLGSGARVARAVGPVRLSVLRPSGLVNARGEPILYNPLVLSRDEVARLIALLPATVRNQLDVLAVDQVERHDRRDQGVRLLAHADLRVALLDADSWLTAITRPTTTLPLSKPTFGGATPVDRAILDAATTVVIPSGTDVVIDSSADRRWTGVVLRRPSHQPYGLMTGRDVTWISYEAHEVNRYVAFARPVGSQPIRAVYSDPTTGERYHEQVVERRAGAAVPIVTPIADSTVRRAVALVVVEPALRWPNPLTETDRRGAFGFSVDPKTGAIEYHARGVPPTRSTIALPPAFTLPSVTER